MTSVYDAPLAALAKNPRAFKRLPELAGAPAFFRMAMRVLAGAWTQGECVFVLPTGREFALTGTRSGPAATLVVRDFRFMRRVLTGGVIGFAEGYIAGEWDTPDLGALLTGMALNLDGLDAVASTGFLHNLIERVRHALRGNSRSGSRRNIHAHYDLGNAFYARWLDQSMTYSSAMYVEPGQDLHEAQLAKYRALGRAMNLQAGHHVLEIGCGWGGFAEYAASEVGAKVTAITISQEQYDYARRRMAEKGLGHLVDIQLIDYRDVVGTFDRVASIEMFEAVGERYWPTYFDKVAEVLKPGGQAALQIITIRDDLFEPYRRDPDFIQKYVFPGGMLPAEHHLSDRTAAAGLRQTGIRRFGQDYADTLAAWLSRFDAAWDEIRHEGFDERFRRIWRFYLAYCEAGFRTGRTDVVQLGLSKP